MSRIFFPVIIALTLLTGCASKYPQQAEAQTKPVQIASASPYTSECGQGFDAVMTDLEQKMAQKAR